MSPPEPATADAGTIRGPYFDKTSKRWALRWTEAGEARSFTNAARPVVAAKRAELTGSGAGVSSLPALKSFSSSEDVKRGLEQAALAANRAACDGNMEALLSLKKYASIMSELSAAMVPHSNHAELEEEHAACMKRLEELQAGRNLDDGEKPAALACPAATLKGRAGPGSKPHRSSDPLSH